jgi:hypothetical protein
VGRGFNAHRLVDIERIVGRHPRRIGLDLGEERVDVRGGTDALVAVRVVDRG